jgi:hypothetical protein
LKERERERGRERERIFLPVFNAQLIFKSEFPNLLLIFFRRVFKAVTKIGFSLLTPTYFCRPTISPKFLKMIYIEFIIRSYFP